MTRSTFVTLLAVAFLTQSSDVSATADEWVVLPTAPSAAPSLTKTIASEVRRELERQGQSVWPAESAAARFERRNSAEPVALSNETLQRWLDDSRTGLRKLALGEPGAALEHLQSAVRMSRSALAHLNRDGEQAQRVLDTCLYLVRALLEVDELADARQQARECAFFVPAGSPQELMHPPGALALYDDATREGAEQPGKLIVESEKAGCAVRINGTLMGRTPFETGALLSGVYAVQVECGNGRPGRIHSVRVRADTTRLQIDTGLDAALRTDPALRLQLRAGSHATLGPVAARTIARALPARWVILVTQPATDTIELDLVGDRGTHMGCARIEVGPLGVRSDSIATAVRDVVSGNCRDASASNAPADATRGRGPLPISRN